MAGFEVITEAAARMRSPVPACFCQHRLSYLRDRGDDLDGC
jgi:hypothetical protein